MAHATCGAVCRVTLLQRTPPPVGPYSSPCLGTFGDPKGVGVSYERGSHVRLGSRGPWIQRTICSGWGRGGEDLMKISYKIRV